MSSIPSSIVRDAERVYIHGGSFSIDNRRTVSDIQALPSGIRTLIHSGRISLTSLYNSVGRMNEANELAVRDAVVGWGSLFEYKKTTSGPSFDFSGVDDAINAIFSWVTDSTAEPLVMWVHDDDRKKTSFIAQVVAYILAEHHLLSATYFFDGNTDRNSLIPTLVHEFTSQDKLCDDLLNEISRVIDSNPLRVFQLTHREQLNRLLVNPVKIVSESYQRDPKLQLQYDIILLHAFEDCNDEGGFQGSFLHALLEALNSIKNSKYPQRLLVIGKRNDHLENFLIGKLASLSPVLQRPVQSQQWLKRDQDIRKKTVELDRWETLIRQSRAFVLENEKKRVEEHRRHTEECEEIKTLCSKKLQEVAEREKMMQEKENRVCKNEELVERMSRDLKKDRLRIEEQEKALQIREDGIKAKEEEFARARFSQEKALQIREDGIKAREEESTRARFSQEKALQIREDGIKAREEEFARPKFSPVEPTTVLENIRLPTRAPTSPTFSGLQSPFVGVSPMEPATVLENIQLPTRAPTSVTFSGLQSPLVDSPIELGIQEDARMISPASQVTRSDRIIILMGPLVPQKRDFIDCLTRCVNTWRLHPLTKTSDQFIDSLGKGRYWVKAVRTQRQSHNVLFVDFPSLGDDDLATAKILENIVTWLTEIRENEIAKITGILYFHPFSEFERGPSHYNLRALGQICGDKAAKKVIFVREGSSLSPSPSTTQNAEAFFYQHYGNAMIGLGATLADFDKTAASGWRIVDRLLGPQSGDVSLFLQDELFVLKRSLHETSAARHLYSDLTVRLRKKLEMSRRSGSGDYNKIQAELETLQQSLSRRSRQLSRHQLPDISARPVNFPDWF